MKIKDRNSNHELMRIISMFFIVLGHVLLFSNLFTTKNENVNMFYYFIEFILIIHVNSYVLVSGFYQSKSKFNQKKIWQIINGSWFYRALISITFLLLGIISINKVQFLKDLVPVTIDNYWFLKTYLLLYCLSPFLNKLILSIQKNMFQKLLIVGFIILCIIPTLTGGELFFNSGYSLYSFVFLYFVGAYLRIYPLEENYFFKIFSKEAYRIIMIIIFISCVLINYIVFYFSKQIVGINEFLDLISQNINSSSLSYSNPIIVIQSIAYFSFFTTLNIKSKIINKCSSLMLGVYMIHENNYLRERIYVWLGLITNKSNYFSFVPYVFFSALLIFISCMIIEWIRQKLFLCIYNLKLSTKIRKKYYEWLQRIYIIRNNN